MHHAGNPVHWALGLTTLKGDRAQLWPPPATTTELCADPRVDPFPVPSQLFHFRRERELLRLRSSWQQLAELPKKGETARVVVGRVVVTLRLGSWAAAPTTQRQQLATCWWPSCCDTKVQRNVQLKAEYYAISKKSSKMAEICSRAQHGALCDTKCSDARSRSAWRCCTAATHCSLHHAPPPQPRYSVAARPAAPPSGASRGSMPRRRQSGCSAALL